MDVIVVSPTMKRAVYEWHRALEKSPNVWKRFRKHPFLMLETTNGAIYRFVTETQADMVTKGFHGMTIGIGTFADMMDKAFVEVKEGD